jgi:phytoene dehydrogenase-like protein
MGKSIIIIGAGISGLATGCYGQMNDYDTHIFEMDSKPGGLCSSWERKGYTIDCCVEWLVGTKPGTGLYEKWRELGVMQNKQVIYMDEFYCFEDSAGTAFHCYTDVNRLEKHMLEISPEDSGVIREFTQGIRKFVGFPMLIDKAPELSNVWDGIKVAARMSSYLNAYRSWSKLPVSEFTSRFSNPLLRAGIESFWNGNLSMAIPLMTMAELYEKSAGYPAGGSQGIVKDIEKRYLGLGGQIDYNSRVEEVLANNDKAIGIKLADGKQFEADYVISAADVHTTIFNVLGGKYIDQSINDHFEKRPVWAPLVFIGLGIDRSFVDFPKIISGLILPLDVPVKTCNYEVKLLSVRVHNFEPAFAHQGKTSVTVCLESDFAYWEDLRKNMSQYNGEKDRIARIVIKVLNKRFPGLADKVEMYDVATPYTFYRYTNTWRGGYMGWLPSVEYSNLYMSKRLPGLDNFFMVNQWIQPYGGLPSGLMNGLHVIQIICSENKQKFITMQL